MANKSTFTCHVWTPQKVVEPGAAAEFGLSEKPTADRYGCRKGIPPPVRGQLFFNSSASITRMPLGPRT
jgi:hypothetical protein